jgi:hypothetical protein
MMSDRHFENARLVCLCFALVQIKPGVGHNKLGRKKHFGKIGLGQKTAKKSLV